MLSIITVTPNKTEHDADFGPKKKEGKEDQEQYSKELCRRGRKQWAGEPVVRCKHQLQTGQSVGLMCHTAPDR